MFSVPSSFLESFRFENAQAGLLTCFRHKHLPGSFLSSSGQWYLLTRLVKHTAAGLFRILT